MSINCRSSHRFGLMIAGALLVAGCQTTSTTNIAPVLEPAPIPAPVMPPVAEPQAVLDPPPLVTSTDPFGIALPVQTAISSDELYEQAKALMEGTPTAQQKESAVVLLNESAELGNSEAMRVLGLLKLKEGPEQEALAIALLERSATNSVRAMRQLGILYGNLSNPHLNNPRKAFEYLSKASAIGDGESSFYLGRLMQRAGRQDESKRLSALALEQGFLTKEGKARKVVAEQSEGVLKSFALQRQAQRGDPESMYQYGKMLLNRQAQGSLMGYEHSADYEAYYWFKRASLMGDEKSSSQVAEMGEIEAMMNKSRMTYEKLDKVLTGRR